MFLHNFPRPPRSFPYYTQVDLLQPSEHCKEDKAHRCLLQRSTETSIFWATVVCTLEALRSSILLARHGLSPRCTRPCNPCIPNHRMILTVSKDREIRLVGPSATAVQH
mmetsp:Transcript_4131/g.26099  ORF Transcript_4131/g.26099 Transcript_4131/m.26099 type:complete len:109 (+) Transcript_4131:1606-1932(+)